MNEITAAIKKKAEEKYPAPPEGMEYMYTEKYKLRQEGYTCGGEDAIGFMLKFVEWMGEEENPFMIVNGRWFQSCGNSTTTIKIHGGQ